MLLFARLGRALRLLRETVGKSQKEVAAAAGITPPMLSAYERERTAPEMETLDKILAQGLGASLADLAWALDVVNERVAPAGRAPAGSRRVGGGRGREAEADPALALLLRRPEAGLPPSLEEGYAQILQGLVQVSRFVLESVARTARTEPVPGSGGSKPRS